MVQFSTSGWRGIVGREVTFRKVRILTQAIVDWLEEEGVGTRRILIGYDTRMLSEKFAATATRLIAANGFEARLAPRDCPAPALAAALLDGSAAAGIIFTASHNPPEYNGLKLYTAAGCAAPVEVTSRIEALYAAREADFEDVFIPRRELMGWFDPKPGYLQRLETLIDWDVIRSSGISLVVDPLFGTTREYLDHILLEQGIPVTVIHNTRDPYFGGRAPDCTSANLSRLRDVMRRTGADLGLATDGDGDRFGILDRGARLKQPGLAIALLIDYLARHRGLQGAVGRSIATTRLIDGVAAEHGLEVVETPVGFKAFGPMLASGRLEVAGEESSGFAWAAHLPERDAILTGLLTAEMVAREGASLHELAGRLTERVGSWSFRRTQVPLSQRLDDDFEDRISARWTTFAGHRVRQVDREDGLYLSLDGGAWVLLRRAGTEPKIRVYAEGRTPQEMRHLIHHARQILSDGRRSHV